MVEELINWLNNEVKLSKKVNNISEDFQNGYLFAELLHKTKIVPDLSIYKNSNDEKDIIHNYCFLTKNLLDMNIILDEKSRNNILQKSPYTAQIYLFKIKQVLNKRLITFDSLKFKESNKIHKLYHQLMFKSDNEKYLRIRENKLALEEKQKENSNKSEQRLFKFKKRFKGLNFNDKDYKLIEQNIKDMEHYDNVHNEILNLEKNRSYTLNNIENIQLKNWNNSMIKIRKDKKKEHDDFWRKVLYYSKATVNYLNKSSIDCQNEIKKFEDNLSRLGLDVEDQKIKKSQNVSTEIILLRMREKLNEKMKQKKDKEKRDRKKLREEMELKQLKENETKER